LANTAFLNSLKPAAPARAMPSRNQFKNFNTDNNLAEVTSVKLNVTGLASQFTCGLDGNSLQ
jgi:hypothetical protein